MIPPFVVENQCRESESVNSEETTKIATKIASLFNRFHAIVVGPGLGRDAKVLDTVYHVVQMACKERIPLVIDGDGLFLLTQHPDMIQGFNNVILTPNHIEFVRLWNSVMPEQPISIVSPSDATLLNEHRKTWIFRRTTKFC